MGAVPDLQDFVGLDRIYTCITCEQVLSDPYQLVCGHHVCGEHLQHMFVNNNSFTCPGQECGSITERNQVFPDESRKREITGLLVRCPYRRSGCKEIIEWRNLPDHCELCCLTTVVCPNKCGEEAITRGQLHNHLQECPLKTSVCPYSEHGCPYSGTDRELKEHEENNVSLHLSMESRFRREREERERAENAELKRQMRNVLEVVAVMKEENQKLHEQLMKTRAEARDLKILMVGYGEKSIHVQRKLQDLVTKEVANKLSNDVSTLKDSLIASNERLTCIERAGHGPGSVAAPALSQLERRVALYDTELNKLNLEVRLLETADHTGTLMWKLRDYQRRKQEAIFGRTQSLFSQPFYTSRYGYRMCARVYLNGDGNGKGTHLSVFFVVMKGDFDVLLEWPFRQQVTLMLLDQSGTGQDIRETFIPQPTGNSFQRPQTEMNVACGVPRFCSLDRLESDMYLRDDTIFLTVKVDCADLRVL
ncbi:TNF receptor-associated factor 3-like [Mizuhopecten yessoensis]|uniref:TNF receptor-associated factor 3 n=1 Tax=Mizuhopecten yessoensis TaxID=6573 RepID=A0A210R3E7_MIZYE|nr:TNF receptor-associated factor 3-like [Mizuhopecten yessoensis]OWF55411.1 TNF receptor-associated factor 3 [Mizuhopecten yessoensis]